MPSSYSTNLELEKQASGENDSTWGDKTNTNLDLIDQAIGGYEEIALSNADVTLSMSQEELSNARNMVLKFTGNLTGNVNISFPDSREKFFALVDGTTHNAYNITFKTDSGTGFNLTEGKSHFAYSDGTNINSITGSDLADINLTSVLNSNNTTTLSMELANLTATNNIEAQNITCNLAITSSNGNVTATSGIVSDSKGEVRSVPLNSQTAAYTLVADDQGKVVSITTGGVTVPSAVFSSGDAVTIFNNSTSDQTITQAASTTMYWSQTGGTGNRTLSQRGVATVLCVSANTFVITGGLLS